MSCLITMSQKELHNGAVSFEELIAIHKRVFDAVGANNDGKVTPEEMQTFMQDL